MDDGPHPPLSHLFTLRLWPAGVGEGRAKWRGKLQHVLSGESRYFQSWPALVVCLRALLSEQSREPPNAQAGGREEAEMS